MKITEELWNSEITKLTVTANKVISQIDIYINVFRRMTLKDGLCFTLPKWAYANLSKENLKKLSDYIITELTNKHDLTPSLSLGNSKTDITDLGLMIIPRFLFGDNILALINTINGYPIISKILYSSDKLSEINDMIQDIQDFCTNLESCKEDEMIVKYSLVSSDDTGFHDNIMNGPTDKVELTQFNEDLPHEIILEALNSNKSGILIFHGAPGCGKTSYIKYLIASNPNLNFSYVSVKKLIDQQNEEKFTDYVITSEDNLIIVVEDCEKLLQSRGYGSSNTTISDILNISSGLIGDQTKTKFIFTFNNSLTTIDDAILRPGRLKCIYEFGPLKGERLKRLLNKLEIDPKNYDLDEGESIANLFNKNSVKWCKEAKKKKIGF